MSVYRCTPVSGPLDAVVSVPGSKSLTNRALAAAAIADGESLLSNVLVAEDTMLMIEALRAMGVAVTLDEQDGVAEITGCRGFLPESTASIYCGNSGTTLRFGTALASLGHGRFMLGGAPRMRERPIGRLVETLQSLGSAVEYLGEEGFPPIIVHARGLRGGEAAMIDPESSQFVSAMLLVAPYAQHDVLLELLGEIPSRPFLSMTVEVMDRFGVSVIADSAEHGGRSSTRFIVPAPQRYQGTTFRIEPDATNASYFLAAPAITGGRVTVEGLGTESLQGDVHFVSVLERMGCRVEREADRLCVFGVEVNSRLRGIDVDLNDMPDVVPTLAVLALFAEGVTTIRNVANLRVKEADRLAALRTELGKLGAEVEEFPDGLQIVPPKSLTPATIETYGDHRMAMSFALAGLKCPGLVINNPECCAKTFPDFFARWDRLAGESNSG